MGFAIWTFLLDGDDADTVISPNVPMMYVLKELRFLGYNAVYSIEVN
jgi:hypothetical protein